MSLIADQLDDESFATAWAHGRGLSHEEAAALALDRAAD
jgi:hypothetical protein